MVKIYTFIILKHIMSVQTSSKRYLSLDVLRGLTIALMVVVNTPGSWSTIYAPFEHAPWHGFTPTDLVFPTFLFVVGNAMSFSLKKYEAAGERAFWQKILKRSLLIFLIGLLLTAFPLVTRTEEGIVWKDFTEMRIMGVLQRIALCYFFASIIIHYLKSRGALALSVFFLLAYWGIMWFFGTHPDPYSLPNNAALKFDLLVFPKENLWKGFGQAFDPEGLLSTLPAIVNVIAGYLCGRFIQKNPKKIKLVVSLLCMGVILLGIGKFWNIFFPINKGIWTSSFVVYSTGWDLLLIALLIFITEIAKISRWTYFFQAFGRNPLFIFIMSGVLIKLLNFIQIDGESLKAIIYREGFQSWLDPYNASLLFALSFMLSLWLLGYVLDRNKIYIKV